MTASISSLQRRVSTSDVHMPSSVRASVGAIGEPL
jgi:hypothetical protein